MASSTESDKKDNIIKSLCEITNNRDPEALYENVLWLLTGYFGVLTDEHEQKVCNVELSEKMLHGKDKLGCEMVESMKKEFQKELYDIEADILLLPVATQLKECSQDEREALIRAIRRLGLF